LNIKVHNIKLFHLLSLQDTALKNNCITSTHYRNTISNFVPIIQQISSLTKRYFLSVILYTFIIYMKPYTGHLTTELEMLP